MVFRRVAVGSLVGVGLFAGVAGASPPRLAAFPPTPTSALTATQALPAATQPRFSAPASNRTGELSTGPVAADLNGDGAVDLATADQESHGISVLLGKGDGSFRKRVAFRTARVPVDIVGADLDADGDLDLATASANRPGSITVLLNDGAAGFRRDRTYAAEAFTVAAADVDRDGRVDLVTGASDNRRGLGVLPGTGAGRFGRVRRLPGPNAFKLDLGDVNGDGAVDAAIGTPNGRVAIRLGAGDGAFGPARSYRTGGDAVGVTLADLDGDGTLDLAASDTGGDNVAIFRGNGDGSLGGRRMYRLGYSAYAVVVADLSGDGVLDIATGAFDGSPAVRIGRGDGTFGKLQYLGWVLFGGGAAADFNGDGWTDLAFAAHEEGDDVSVFLNWTAAAAPPCVVLNVRRDSLRTARRYIRLGGCGVGQIRRGPSRPYLRGLVVAQHPRPATVLPNGSLVDLTIGNGRRR